MELEHNLSPDRIVEDVSDADSDLEELQGDIARFDESVREFLATHRGAPDSGRGTRGVSRGRGARGPRKAAKPRGDITARLSKVNQAFLCADYDQALDLAFEVIRINAETHQAWTALSSIFRERHELDRALSAMVYAAHLRPKDVSGWLRCASFALDSVVDDESSNLHTARLCYSAALRADPSNVEARLGKADVCHRQGHLSAAILEYNYILKRHPYDLDIVRKLAETSIDNKHAATAISSAITAYRHYFDHAIDNENGKDQSVLWHDIGIYAELVASTGRFQQAIQELKYFSRWILGRSSETFWDQWQLDDREWDVTNDRRSSVPEFISRSVDKYGLSLPLDLRIRLVIFRLKTSDQEEALHHLDFLHPEKEATHVLASDFPFLIYDLGVELSRCGQSLMAIQYFELLRHTPGDPDAGVMLQLGRCHLDLGDQAAAEEFFLAALDADEDNIEARIELANMYEKARDDEEALIFAAEAMALRARDQPGEDNGLNSGPSEMLASADAGSWTFRRHPRQSGTRGTALSIKAPKIPRRYRAKRLADADKRQKDEHARALKLSRQYQVVQDLKQKIAVGHRELVPEWMASSKELIDDFRSLKRFYTWDKYLHFLRSNGAVLQEGLAETDTELSQMYERLTRSIAPQSEYLGDQPDLPSATHQGISFDDWLDLFLDYAIGLAIAHRRLEAYQVCEAAKDSTVFRSPKNDFTIHMAWSVCAIYTNDEERCVAIARHIMRNGTMSDSYRMFALLSTLCQSPVSWYTSGPAQKYIMRQIKAIDASHETAVMRRGGDGDVEHTNAVGLDIDICLLMLYGHILFTSTSYSYALGYFLRARSLDPSNPMVNLSLGLAYVHYGLKRQSANRQYLILQGQAFLSQYARQYAGETRSSLAECYYNMGRLFHLLGIGYLSSRYYEQALETCRNEGGGEDLSSTILANTIISLLTVGNKKAAYSVLKRNLIL